jgi:hypothetical protein
VRRNVDDVGSLTSQSLLYTLGLHYAKEARQVCSPLP